MPDEFAPSPSPSASPESGSSTPPPLPTAAGKIHWGLFFGVFLTPLLLTVAINLAVGRRGDLGPSCAFIGSLIAGLACGVMLGIRFGKNPAAKIGLGIVFTLVMMGACLGVSCAGCIASGYQLKF